MFDPGRIMVAQCTSPEAHWCLKTFVQCRPSCLPLNLQSYQSTACSQYPFYGLIPFPCWCRAQGYAAHVRIASKSSVMSAEDFDEILSFGTYSSSEKGPFKPHASLYAQANGSLSVKAAGLNLLPGGGASSVGSGSHSSRSPTPICICCLMLVCGACHGRTSPTLLPLLAVQSITRAASQSGIYSCTHPCVHAYAISCYGVGLPVLPVCLIADDKPADLTVYGNVFVRPRLSSTNTTSGSVTSRRRLLQSGAFCCCCSSTPL